jgi:hypothetical protein
VSQLRRPVSVPLGNPPQESVAAENALGITDTYDKSTIYTCDKKSFIDRYR